MELCLGFHLQSGTPEMDIVFWHTSFQMKDATVKKHFVTFWFFCLVFPWLNNEIGNCRFLYRYSYKWRKRHYCADFEKE